MIQSQKTAIYFKDTHWEKTPSNKTEAVRKSTTIWAIGIFNELFIADFFAEIEVSKNEVVRGKSQFFVIVPLCTPYSICLNSSF